jgi:hypothetical protein
MSQLPKSAMRLTKSNSKQRQNLAARRNAPLATRTDLPTSATKDIAGAMNFSQTSSRST